MTDTLAARARLSHESGRLYLCGALDHDSVAHLYAAGRARIQQAKGSSMDLDLSRLDSSDSSGLALLVDWLRTARENSVQLHFHNVPRQLRDIAGVCGLGEFLDSLIFDSLNHAS